MGALTFAIGLRMFLFSSGIFAIFILLIAYMTSRRIQSQYIAGYIDHGRRTGGGP
jgi:hypothetical protein